MVQVAEVDEREAGYGMGGFGRRLFVGSSTGLLYAGENSGLFAKVASRGDDVSVNFGVTGREVLYRFLHRVDRGVLGVLELLSGFCEVLPLSSCNCLLIRYLLLVRVNPCSQDVILFHDTIYSSLGFLRFFDGDGVGQLLCGLLGWLYGCLSPDFCFRYHSLDLPRQRAF